MITERGRPVGDGGESDEGFPIRKAAITVIGGFIGMLFGLYLAYGFPAVLIAGGATAFVFGLVWETE